MQDVLTFPTDLGAPTITWARRRFRKAVQPVVRLARNFAAWSMRRKAVRALHALDDRMLADMGVNRSEIEAAVRHNPRSGASASAGAPRRDR